MVDVPSAASCRRGCSRYTLNVVIESRVAKLLVLPFDARFGTSPLPSELAVDLRRRLGALGRVPVPRSS